MKQLMRVLLIITMAHMNHLNSMEDTLSEQAGILQLPKEIFSYIVGHSNPMEKNILMRVCKLFYSYMKDRTFVLKANPFTVSIEDRRKDAFKYATANNIHMMKLLLESGVNSNYKNFLGITLFHILSDNKNIEAMQLLVDHGADTRILKPQMHPLHEAICKGDEDFVKELIKLGIDPNLNLDQIFPLDIALRQGHINIARLLIDAGANIDNVNHNGRAPLHLVSSWNDIIIVKFLLRAKADINKTDNRGWTPLMIASGKNHIIIVELLLQAKADINKATKGGLTPLLITSYYGHIEMIKLLLHNGANIYQALNWDLTDTPLIKKGDTALEIAQKQGHYDIVELLQNHALRDATAQKKIRLRQVVKEKPNSCIVQ